MNCRAQNRRGSPLAQPESQNVIICAKRDDPFARIPKTILDDPALSWRAKGVLCYLLGKPPGWKCRAADIIKHATEGKAAVWAALKQLRKVGYAQLVQIRDGGGRVVEWVWKISDSPIFQSPDTDFQHLEKPDLENRHISKNEGTKKEFSKNESKESKVTANEFAAGSVEEFGSTWKPDGRTKKQKLASIKMPKDYPSEREFDRFLETESLDGIAAYRPDFYDQTCRNKWHTWRADIEKWARIIDWRKYVAGLNATIDYAHGGG